MSPVPPGEVGKGAPPALTFGREKIAAEISTGATCIFCGKGNRSEMGGRTGDGNTRMSPRPLGDSPLPLTWLGAAAFQAFLFVLVVVLISPAAAVDELPAGSVCRAVVPAQEGGTARARHPGDSAVCWGGEEFKGGVCWAQTSPKFSWRCPRKWW